MSDALLGVAGIAAFSVLSFGLFLLALASGSRLSPEARSWTQRYVFVPARAVIGAVWAGCVLYRFGTEAWRTGGRSWFADAILGVLAILILMSVYNLLKNHGNKLRALHGRRPETAV